MKLIALIFLILSSSFALGMELKITSHYDGQVYQDGNGRIDLLGQIIFESGDNPNGNLGKVTCNGKQAQVQGGTYQWRMNYFEILPGNNLISCSYSWNGATVTKEINFIWEITAQMFIDSPKDGYRFRDPQGRLNLEGHVNFQNPQDVSGNLAKVTCNDKQGQVQGGTHQWRINSFKLPAEGLNQINCTYTWNGKTTNKSITVFWSKNNFPPSAEFTITPETGTAPLEVNFNASASVDPDGEINSYSWAFSDGHVASGVNVSHTFQQPGKYEITLTIVDNENASTVVSKSITVEEPVNQAPVAAVTANPSSGEVPLDVTFDGALSYDPDGSISQYIIEFGDGTPEESSSVPYINHRYEIAGDYTVTFKVIDNKGEVSDPVTTSIHVFQPNAPPVAVIAANVTSGQSPLTVEFSGAGSSDPDGTIQSYTWSFPDGTIKTGMDVTHTLTGMGPQIVTLTVVDDRNVPGSSTITIELTEDTDLPVISLNPSHNSVIRTSTPQFEITHTDATSGINLGSLRAYLNGEDLTSRLNTAPDRSFLTFTHDFPITQGNYELRIEVNDNAGNLSVIVQNYVVNLGIIDTAYIVGQVIAEDGTPLENVTIQDIVVPVGLKIFSKTMADGKFKIPFSIPGTYRFSISKNGFTESVRTVQPVVVTDIDMGIIKLGEADPAIVPVSAATGGTASNSTGTLVAHFEPGDLPFDITFNSKEYTDQETMPGPLPPQSAFTYAFDMRPQGINFGGDGVTVLLDNHLGFPIGTEIVYGIFDRELGRWLDSGRSMPIIATNKTNNGSAGQLNEPFFVVGDPNIPFVCKEAGSCNPPDGGGSGGAGGGSDGGGGGGCKGNNPCCPGAGDGGAGGGQGGFGGGAGGVEGGFGGGVAGGLQGGGLGGPPTSSVGCEISQTSGDLSVTHNTPSLIGGGSSYSVNFRYHSTSVKPHFFAGSELNIFNPEPADFIKSSITIAGRTRTVTYEGSGATKKTLYRTLLEAKNADEIDLPTGLYTYTNSLSVGYSNSEYATASYFGGPPQIRLGVLARVPVTFTTEVVEDVPILNRKLSPFGAGWSISGFERLHVSPSRKILRDNGGKRTIQYTPTAIAPSLEAKKLVSKKSSFAIKIDSLAAFDGVVYGADCENNQVFRIMSDGTLDVVAGNGSRGFSGDGGLAVHASLNCPIAIAKAETGGFYIADRENYKIRRVFQDGTIKTIATHKNKPLSVSEDKMRAVFFTTSNEVMLITPRGKLETYSSENGGYLSVKLNNPSQVLFNNEDYPIVVDKNNERIINLYPQNQSYLTLFGKGGFSKTNKNGAIKPKTLTFDPVSHLYYLLDSEGKLYHWDGKGSKELTELTFTGAVLKEKRFAKKANTKISAMAYSPETGMVIVTDGQLFMKKKSKNAQNSLVSYTTQKGFTDELTRLENGTYEIVDIDKTKITYNERGYISAILRPDGKNTFYQYFPNDLLKEIQHFGGVRFFFEYDGRGYLQTVRDSSGRETHFDIDDAGNLVRIESPDGTAKEYSYNSDSLLTSETKEDGEFTEFNYVMNKISSEIIAGNRQRFFNSISIAGIMPTTDVKDSDPAPVIVPEDIQSIADDSKSGDCKVKFRVNNMGAMTEREDCLGNKTLFTPDENGMFTRIQSPEGRVINRTFDTKLRPIRTQDAAGTTVLTYDPISGRVASIKDSLNYTSYISYNVLGLPETITDAAGNVTTQSYNSFGNLIMTRDALGNESHLSYDDNQNLQMVTDPFGNSVEYTRDAAGNVIQVKDQLSRVTNYEFDNYNRLTAILAPLNYNTYLTYTPKGEIKTLTDASNATTSWDYDPVSFKVSKVTNAEGQEERLIYDLNNRLIRKVNKDGTFVNFSYDLKGRLISRSSVSQNNIFSYDKDDLLVFASNSDATVTLNYDQFGRLTSTESSHVPGHIVMTYDTRGLKKSLNYIINGESIFFVSYSYNERKLLSEMNASLGGQEVSWQRYWDELGRPETDILSNGLKVQRSYDTAGRLTYLSNEYATGEPLSRFNLSYNPTGTIKEITKTFIRPGQSTPGQYVLKYQFDDLDRLTYASTDGSFSYDIMGNHTNHGQIHNALNHLLEDTDYTYSYTVNGQLSQKVNKLTGEKTEYRWSVEGKSIQTTVRKFDSTIKAQLTSKFDSFDRRVTRISGSEEVRYAYAGQDIVVEFGPNDSIRAIYLHGPGIDEPIAMVRDINRNGTIEEKELFFYSKDHLNSVHDLTDYQGKPIQRYNYTAYGKTKIEKTNPDQNAKVVQNIYAYTSREWELEIGDYYFRDRSLDPNTGRFLTEDRIGFSGQDENFYRFVKNNPIVLVDPYGFYPHPADDGASTPASRCLNRVKQTVQNSCEQERSNVTFNAGCITAGCAVFAATSRTGVRGFQGCARLIGPPITGPAAGSYLSCINQKLDEVQQTFDCQYGNQ